VLIASGPSANNKAHPRMTPDFLVTHSGGFHADELLSSVILTRLFPHPPLRGGPGSVTLLPHELVVGWRGESPFGGFDSRRGAGGR